MPKPHVALLGLGTMGAGMAGRLLSAGFPLSVYNRNRERARSFVDHGAALAGSPREAAATAEIIISMVADDPASREVWSAENGALASAKPGTVLIESSTLSVGWIKELAALGAQRSCELLDAPVTGTKPHAESGQLLFLVGGSEQALERVRPVLAVLGRDAVYLGPTGSGALMKLINNFLAAVEAVSFGEALALIRAGGLDWAAATSILCEGAPGSPILKRVTERVASGDFTPHFHLNLMAKDVSYAIEEGRRRHLNLETAAAALAAFRRAIASGLGEKDFTAVVQEISSPSAKTA
ncbi:MAG TPA: NAD(P)-dependent oxidoreductase [Terriglobales bacterium]|nr:NAD(P)-dependent oxidoreductase [Terriglobales bacterium]